MISGDFDIQIDWEEINSTQPSLFDTRSYFPLFWIFALEDDTDLGFIGVANHITYNDIYAINSSEIPFTTLARSHTSGKLKITRSEEHV